jgi:hypothetical protein
MRLPKGRAGSFRREPYDQVGFQNATTHVAVDHEGEPSEHLLFGKFAGALQDRPYAVCQMEVVCHEYSAELLLT